MSDGELGWSRAANHLTADPSFRFKGDKKAHLSSMLASPLALGAVVAAIGERYCDCGKNWWDRIWL
jgi:hypothetical protein